MKPLMTALIVALVVLTSSNAAANPILELKITEPSDIGISLRFFVSDSNDWPGGLPPASIATAGGIGAFNELVELPVADLSNVYFTGLGSFAAGFGVWDTFVAEPAAHVPDSLAWAFGPPWISLAGLTPDSALSGDLWIINGPPYNGSSLVGRWELSEAATETPEPATCLLIGTGLAVAGLRRGAAARERGGESEGRSSDQRE